jgi:hypothetical protein
MAGKRTEQTRSYVYWDTVGSGANPIAPFQIVSLADASEVTAAQAAGVRDAVQGRLVVATPVGSLLGSTIATRRIVGVTTSGCFSGDEVMVQFGGIADVMVNAAVACDAMVHAVARTTRTTAQTPFTSLGELMLPFDPRATLTYQLCMADDPALTFSSSGANVTFYPLGVACAAATAQYDIIPVELMLFPQVG